MPSRARPRASLLLTLFFLPLATGARAAEGELPAAAAARDAAQAVRMIALPKEQKLKLDVWATEPLLANPVAFAFDEKGRVYVSETHRLNGAVLESRARERWPSKEFRAKASPERLAQIGTETLDDELACRTVEDREAMVRKYFVGDLDRFTKSSEVIRFVADTNGDGKADTSKVFAEGFNELLGGVASGVLLRKGEAWFTNIPHVWWLRDKDGDGVADERKSHSYGYGVRYGFVGHDMHGLRIGPDGKLYWSIGDRGAHVATADGRAVSGVIHNTIHAMGK